MDEQRRNAILAKAYRNIEAVDEILREPYVPRELTWQPRQAEPEPPVRRTPDAVNLRQIEQLRRDHEKLASNTGDSLHALADEAGAETGKLQRQITELQKQVEEMRGEIALLRATALKASNADSQSRQASRRKPISRAPFPDIPADEQRH